MNRTLFRVLLVTVAALVGSGNLSLAIDPPAENPDAVQPAAPPPVVNEPKPANPGTVAPPDTSVANGSEARVLPLRHTEANGLATALNQLLATSRVVVVADERSNSLSVRATSEILQRVGEIIQAIDSSGTSISTIKVFPLRFVIARDLATIITQLFATPSTSQQRSRGDFGGFGGGGGNRGGGLQSSGNIEARQTASRGVAVADEKTNSLIVCATEEALVKVSEIVAKIDTNILGGADIRIYRLQHRDAAEMAETIN